MNMSSSFNLLYLLIAAAVLLGVVALASWLAKKRFAKLDMQRFTDRWQEVQGLCKREDTWPLAIINADKVLDDALKKTHFKGKTMGERLVSAQRQLTDNDAVWFGHKLRNKLVHEDFGDLRKKDVLKALAGFRQALRDLGAMK